MPPYGRLAAGLRVSIALFASGALAATIAPALAGPSDIALPPVDVDVAAPGGGLDFPLGSTTLTEAELAGKKFGTNDSASLLKDILGASTYSAGGVSSLPVIHGMADDRVKTLVNGVPITAACSNHMNPALSYVDPSNVGKVAVWAGITPVSAGGDSIGGTIEVETPPPVFAKPGEKVHTAGSLSTDYRSTNRAISLSGKASVANDGYSVGYDGSWARAGNYHRGGSNAPVLASRYQTENHTATLARRGDRNLAVIEGGWQFIPYEGFPNQRMDMTGNDSKFGNARYESDYKWGKLNLRAHGRTTAHEMNYLDQVKSAAAMPMNTKSTDLGYSIKAEILLTPRDTARVGNEFHHSLLDDWWPSVGTGSTGMLGADFININKGERNRMGTFAEWEAKWTPQWTTLLGVRNDTVWMDTGNVQGYNASNGYPSDASTFNGQDRGVTDINFDLTGLARYEPDKNSTYEVGYARKTRSPSLYERYTWSSGTMASNMNNWFGDGNGYVGDIKLSPEVAHTTSISGDWHDSARKLWGVKVTPYYTYVRDYIDGDRYSTFTAANAYGKLKLANHDAQLYGTDIASNLEVWDVPQYGRGVLTGLVGWTVGENMDTNDNLYNIMPLNVRLALNHQLGGWQNAIELQGVADKATVSRAKNEIKTPAYALVNLRTGYEWENVAARIGIENLFNKYYQEALGGTDYSETRSWGRNVAGPGRSYMAGMTVKF